MHAWELVERKFDTRKTEMPWFRRFKCTECQEETSFWSNTAPAK